jgi:rfaE bifunctional protein nucleotidyltransferase chain/domain
MKTIDQVHNKIVTREQATKIVQHWKDQGMEIVFTNGCFDILHRGHIEYLFAARTQGDRLVIGVNSDHSVKLLKGPDRPVNDEQSRMLLLGALECADLVVLFDEETPLSLIQLLLPDILVKGGDWKVEQIVGADIVTEKGGKVLSLAFVDGFSTTGTIAKIQKKGS